MIEFKNVNIAYTHAFYTLLNFSYEFEGNTLILDNTINGHSAIMRLISKIDTDYKGEIFLNGKNVKKIKDKDLCVAYLPQTPTLFKNKTVENNLAYPLKIRKTDKNTIKSKINSLFKTYNLNIFNNPKILLNGLLKTKIKHLTLDEQKIIALLRISLWQPKIVLLENFFENLNTEYHKLAEEIILNISKNAAIIASEKTLLPTYENFDVLDLNNKT